MSIKYESSFFKALSIKILNHKIFIVSSFPPLKRMGADLFYSTNILGFMFCSRQLTKVIKYFRLL